MGIKPLKKAFFHQTHAPHAQVKHPKDAF